MQETWVWSLGWEDPLEKGMATHSNILAQRIPWTAEPGGLQSRVTKSWTWLKQLSTHAHTSLKTLSPNTFTFWSVLRLRTSTYKFSLQHLLRRQLPCKEVLTALLERVALAGLQKERGLASPQPLQPLCWGNGLEKSHLGSLGPSRRPGHTTWSKDEQFPSHSAKSMSSECWLSLEAVVFGGGLLHSSRQLKHRYYTGMWFHCHIWRTNGN